MERSWPRTCCVPTNRDTEACATPVYGRDVKLPVPAPKVLDRGEDVGYHIIHVAQFLGNLCVEPIIGVITVNRTICIFCVLLLAALTVPSLAATKTVHVVPIEGIIDLGLAALVERAVDEAKEESVDAIVFDIDTPGGRLDAALIIRDAILYTDDLITIAFINPRAISAGALISLACDHIVMVGGGTIGAATAVDIQGEKASEKIISYFRNEMKATAEKTGRDPKLAEAMVDEDVDIPDLAPQGKLLTLTTEEAVKHEIADRKVEASDEEDQLREILEAYDLVDARIERIRVNWAEYVVRFLTHPVISSLLMTIGFLGLIFEIRTPGWGVGGTAALLALALFFGSHLIVHLAGWGEILLFGIGVVFLLIEVLYIPDFGIVGVLGILLILGSLFLSLMGRVEFWTVDEISRRITQVGLAIIVSFILSIILLKSLPRVSAWNRLILQAEERTEQGFRSAPSEHEELMGSTGVALSMLRPAGTGQFGDKRIAVVTEATYIPKGAAIKVIAVEGNRVVVREA